MFTTNVEARRTACDSTALTERHPRGRGFGILSRLARVEDVTGRHVRESAGSEEQTAALAFQRPRPDARHRRDDVARGMLHFG